MAQATLNGYLTDDGGEPCNAWFEWGVSTAYGFSTPVISGLRTGNSFSYQLTGLNDGTVYHYRAVAQNSRMVVYGADEIFITPAGEHMMTLIPHEIAFMLESA